MNRCGDCQHWTQHAANPANLTAPALGDCRGAPPQLITIPVGPGQMQLQAHYPVVPADFAACAHFKAVLDLSRCLTR